MESINHAPPERISELWAHLFEELDGYLVTFTGRQSTNPSARPNELDGTAQRSWRWPEQKDEAAAYLIEQSEAGGTPTSACTSSGTGEPQGGERRGGPRLWVTATVRRCRRCGRSRPR
jgi:hypothetical protein